MQRLQEIRDRRGLGKDGVPYNSAYADIKYLLDALEQAQKDIKILSDLYVKNVSDSMYRERVLREALEFYANKDHHEQYYIGDGEPAVLEDAGKIARVALGQEKPSDIIPPNDSTNTEYNHLMKKFNKVV